jgi:hypothetical protein
MRLYHVTSRERAERILADGFRDSTGTYMNERKWTGVWLSDSPAAHYVPWNVDAVLVLDLPDDEINRHECVQPDLGYRDFLVPAELLNQHPIKHLSDE